MYDERVSWLALSRVHLKLSCACGHEVTWPPDRLKAMPLWLTTSELERRAKCTACGERGTLSPWIMRSERLFGGEEKLVPYVRTRFGVPID